MSPERIPAPDADEYAPFYAAYVALVRERDPLGVLKRQMQVLRAACAGMTDAEALQRYGPGKWSVKQVVGHLADSERIFAYRLLRVARGDATPLAGFEENAYVEAGGFESREIRGLLQEFESVRTASLRLLETLPREAWSRRGVANGSPVSARALAFVMAGHAEHHLAILRERYGLAIPHVEAPPA